MEGREADTDGSLQVIPHSTLHLPDSSWDMVPWSLQCDLSFSSSPLSSLDFKPVFNPACPEQAPNTFSIQSEFVFLANKEASWAVSP